MGRNTHSKRTKRNKRVRQLFQARGIAVMMKYAVCAVN